jgi:redox-sensitive bicupin YhaK (pirin superfamily)
MSWNPAQPPSDQCPAGHDVELVIETRSRDLGGVIVGRVLPSPRRRLVGPFLFFDEMGPVELADDHSLTVRPHPHVCLATVTYLFEGEIVHRDSLGTTQTITPGAINWMTAGKGIVHSERAPHPGGKLHGIQLWCALPKEHEETEPTFEHCPASSIPETTIDGATVRVLAGDAYGLHAPVKTWSKLFYVDVVAPTAATIEAPDHAERAIYIVSGYAQIGGDTFDRGKMLVLASGRTVRIELEPNTRIVMLGGDPLDGPRHMYWNFVASTKERIEQAKEDWRERRFPIVPGDETEFIPLPDDAH